MEIAQWNSQDGDNYLAELVELVDEPHMGNCTVSHPASVQGIVVKFQLRAHPIQLELDHKYYSPSSIYFHVSTAMRTVVGIHQDRQGPAVLHRAQGLQPA